MPCRQAPPSKVDDNNKLFVTSNSCKEAVVMGEGLATSQVARRGLYMWTRLGHIYLIVLQILTELDHGKAS